MSRSPHRDHLEHLPGRTYLLALVLVAALAVVASVTQLVSADRTLDSVLWSIAVGVGTLSLLALGVAWEERRAHVHALVREALEEDQVPEGADPIAELLRLGAHREVEYLRARAGHATTAKSS